MSIPLIINGQTFQYPETGDPSWGLAATSWAAAVTAGMLQKAGGAFTLLADVDFGTGFGLKSLYYKTRTVSPASAGQFRLAKTDVISWRNNAGGGNLDLSVNSSDALLFNGIALGNFVTASDTNSIDLTLTAGDLTADLKLSSTAAGAGFLKITNSIDAGGLLSLAPLADTSTTGALSSTDWNTFNGKQAAGSYITALTGNVAASGPGSAVATIQAGVIVDSMINASAAIAFSKLATLTSAHILVGSSGNVPTSVAVSGDITISNTGVTAIGANKVANSQLAQMAAHTFKGNKTGSTANAADLTATELTAELNVMTGDAGSGGLKGLVPAQATGDATKFLSGAGTWTSPAGSGDVVGPGSATDGDVVLFDGVTGKLIKDSGLVGSAALVNATTQSFGGAKTFTTQLIGKGTVAADDAATGYIGEYIVSKVTSNTSVPGIDGVFGDATSLVSLPAGDWDLSAVMVIEKGTATVVNLAEIGISPNSGSSATGLVFGDNWIGIPTSAAALTTETESLVLPAVRVNISTPTTYYLKLLVAYAGGTPLYVCRLSARRVR